MKKESISVFDIFKIGIGPSSSHTLGPWRAALRFIESVKQKGIGNLTSVRVLLYGSLAKTGKGHGTDVAVLLGLCGEDPVTFDVDQITPRMEQIAGQKKLNINSEHEVDFDPVHDVVFLFDESLPFHPNALTFLCSFSNGDEIAETYYSIGGGFVVKEGEEDDDSDLMHLPYPIEKAEFLLAACDKTGLDISGVVMLNEHTWRTEAETKAGVWRVWETMRECIFRGCHIGGELPGGLQVKRRAFELNKTLTDGKPYTTFDDWLAVIRSGGNGFKSVISAPAEWVQLSGRGGSDSGGVVCHLSGAGLAGEMA